MEIPRIPTRSYAQRLVELAAWMRQLRAARDSGPGERRRLALETFRVHAPLAERLGLDPVQGEMLSLAYRLLEPELAAG